MSIEKKLIHVNNFDTFNSKKLSANEANTQYTEGVNSVIKAGSPDISYQSLVFIKDTNQIWTHGNFYSDLNNYGKRNLLLKTNQGVTNYSVYNGSGTIMLNDNYPGIFLDNINRVASSTALYYNIDPSIIQSGKKYTVSFDVKQQYNSDEQEGIRFRVGVRTKSATNNLTDWITVPKHQATVFNKWVRMSVTLTATSDGLSNGTQVLYIEIPAQKWTQIYIKNLQLVEGASASDWLPAPEDFVLQQSGDDSEELPKIILFDEMDYITPEELLTIIYDIIENGTVYQFTDGASLGVIHLNFDEEGIMELYAFKSVTEERIIKWSASLDLNTFSVDPRIIEIPLGGDSTGGSIGGSSGGSTGGSSAYPEVNHGTSNTTFELTPNTFHVWDEVSTLDLTLSNEISGIANEYLFQFTSGSTPTTLILPDDIKFSDDLTIEASKIYQISILKGLGSVMSWDNAPNIIDNYLRITGTNLVFDYPVASDVVVSVFGRPTSAAANSVPTNFDLQYSVGTQSMAVKSVLRVDGITPLEDDTYHYINSI